MSAPLISVIMGVYNTAPYLAEAIESVLGQTYAPIELVVIDDGSDDGSGEIARGFGDAIVYAYQENAGNGAARNHAARLATGELFAFLDADDRFVPDKLTRQWQALSRAPELDMVFGHMSEFVSPEVSEEERRALRPPAPVPTP